MQLKISFWRRFQHFFLTTVLGGLVVVLPFTLFLFIVRLVFRFISNLLNPIKLLFESVTLATWVLDLIALAIVLLFFFLVGLVVRTRLGRYFFMQADKRLIESLPLYKVLRDTVQQFFGKGRRTPFGEVVLVDVYNSPTRMLGFVASELPDNRLSVFVPTGPNPTNGFIFFVDRSQTTTLPVGVEDAMRVILAVGAGADSLFKATTAEPFADAIESENTNP